MSCVASLCGSACGREGARERGREGDVNKVKHEDFAIGLDEQGVASATG